MSDPLDTEEPNPTVGRYTVLSKLGEGGMAEIFLGEIRGTDRFAKKVVIKMLLEEHHDDRQLRSMFADEARVGAQMEYPHIAHVLELGDHNGLPFMVQEFVDGPSLSAVLQRQREQRRIDLRMSVRIIADIARALDHAHTLIGPDGKQLKLIHRDVSPSNILIARQGVAKLIDFGVARFENRETHTEANLLKGKLRYLAPETIVEGEVSHQSDVFALGVVLYIACTARSPWRNAQELARRLQGTFDKPSKVVPGFPAELESIILQTLAASPADRTADAATLARQLDNWLLKSGGPIGNDALAEFIRSTFPEGQKGWLPDYELEGSTLTALNRSQVLKRPRGNASWPLVTAGLVMAVVLAIVAVFGSGLVAWVALNRSPEVVVERVDPTAKARTDFEAILLLAEAARDDGQRAAVRRHLRALDRIAVSEPSLLARADELAEWADYLDELDALTARLPDEAKEVLARITVLEGDHPDDPVLAQLRTDAEAAIEAAQPEPEPAPRPRPRPKPAAPSMLKVDGSPPGAEVVVDGRFVGTVPVQLVVDPGPHDVALRKEGYIQKRQNIEADGKTIQVRLDLPKLSP